MLFVSGGACHFLPLLGSHHLSQGTVAEVQEHVQNVQLKHRSVEELSEHVRWWRNVLTLTLPPVSTLRLCSCWSGRSRVHTEKSTTVCPSVRLSVSSSDGPRTQSIRILPVRLSDSTIDCSCFFHVHVHLLDRVDWCVMAVGGRGEGTSSSYFSFLLSLVSHNTITVDVFIINYCTELHPSFLFWIEI